MKVVVLGAGVVGVATAWFLARGGATVVVVDRQPGAGLETSFANGGQISANHTTPWATPATPWKALKWLGQADAPLLFHLRLDPALASWLVRFLANCTALRMRANTERALRLAVYSRQQLAAVRAATGIAYDQLTRGILHIFRNPKDYAEALPLVELMNSLGCRREVIDADACVGLEPALADARPHLVGGIFSPDDESGDAHAFTVGLAEACAAEGVTFQYGTTIQRLVRAGQAVSAVKTEAGTMTADAFVVACGSYSPLLLRPLGIRLPVYPAKGYSVTIPVAAAGSAPVVSLIDDEFKMVYSRLGNRLRIAGTAEFAGYDTTVWPKRAMFLREKAMELFPRCGDPGAAEFWAGLRPSTPDGVPVMGATPLSGLFLNTGHGTLGWTMACGAGRVVADVILGQTPEIALDGFGSERFR
ncbi:MAG: D-amino acid dehydrogenase [Defluviicoccus sp.]|nr:D-amino acid dehydrogenase [Defluviicoccus sp.]MDG4592449.1 D-amino acid dehydrogenase [Defluviicoccus sp.]